jgi:hypothetical protein
VRPILSRYRRSKNGGGSHSGKRKTKARAYYERRGKKVAGP